MKLKPITIVALSAIALAACEALDEHADKRKKVIGKLEAAIAGAQCVIDTAGSDGFTKYGQSAEMAGYALNGYRLAIEYVSDTSRSPKDAVQYAEDQLWSHRRKRTPNVERGEHKGAYLSLDRAVKGDRLTWANVDCK